MVNILVSIVIPVYNVIHYLEKCVDSVLNQTYKNIEIILIDDGSTDGSQELCDKFINVDKRIVVFHKMNGGLSSARNYGLAKANGKYIYFLDSDDYIEKDTIKLLVKEAEKNNLDFITFNGQCFLDNPDNKLSQQNKYAYKKTDGKYGISHGSQLFVELKNNREYYPAVPMHFYNLSFLRTNNLEFKEGILHEDELFSILAYFKAKKVGCFCKILYWRRLRSNSIMSNVVTLKNVDSCRIIVQEIINIIESQFFSSLDEDSQFMLKLGLAHCLWLYFLRYEMLTDKEKKTAKNSINKVVSNIIKNDYYGSKEIRKCYIKRFFSPLRKSKILYDISNRIRRKLS